MEEDISQRLAADVEVSALVGTRIYPDAIESGTEYPCMALSYNTDVLRAAKCSPESGMLEVYIHAVSKAQAIQVRKSVITCLNGWRGLYLLAKSDDYVAASKKNLSIVTFKIVRTW